MYVKQIFLGWCSLGCAPPCTSIVDPPLSDTDSLLGGKICSHAESVTHLTVNLTVGVYYSDGINYTAYVQGV
jgi:hypothetical protein